MSKVTIWTIFKPEKSQKHEFSFKIKSLPLLQNHADPLNVGRIIEILIFSLGSKVKGSGNVKKRDNVGETAEKCGFLGFHPIPTAL